MTLLGYLIAFTILLFYVNFFLLLVWGLPNVLGRGVTRTVVKFANVTIKLPFGLAGYSPWELLRGIMANQSEWQQRDKRDDIVKPLWTIFYVFQAYPVCTPMVSTEPLWNAAMRTTLLERGYSAEEAGYTAWMWLGDKLVLVDYDRSDEEPRSRLARLYYWNENRKYNKWARDGLYDIPPEELD